MNTENNQIPKLLEELGKLIANKVIANNYEENGSGCIEKDGIKRNDCECEGTEGLTYEDKDFAYLLYLETGKFEKIPREK